MKKCVDLRDMAKPRRWRVRYDESMRADGISKRSDDAPWYVEIECRHGTLYPLGGSRIAVCAEGTHNIRRAIARLQCTEVHQGDDVFSFDLSDLEEIVRIMRPKRWGGRAATEEDRARLYAIGKRFGFEGGR